MKYPRVIGFLISPVTGRLLTYEQLPPLDKGEIWIGHVYNQKAVPSLKLIDLRIDVNSLIKEVDNIASLPFILKTPSHLIPNAQTLNGLGTGIVKVIEGGSLALAIANEDYATAELLEQIEQQCQQYAQQSETSAGNAATSAAAAAASATESTTAAAVASASAGEASASAAAANVAAVSASGSASSASNSASESASSASSASSSASSASASATNAANSATNAQTSLNTLLNTELTLQGDINGNGLLSSAITTSFSNNPILPGTEAMTIPVGNTAQRPSTPTLAMIRYNEETFSVEHYQGLDGWLSFLTTITGDYQQFDITPDVVFPYRVAIKIVDNPVIYGAESITIPKGLTSQRPVNSNLGMIRVNTETGLIENYDGNNWRSSGTVSQVTAGQGLAGGTITESGTIYIPDDPTIPGSGAIKIPSGTTAQRPTTTYNGMIRFNTEAGSYEIYNSGWYNIRSDNILINLNNDVTGYLNLNFIGDVSGSGASNSDIQLTLNLKLNEIPLPNAALELNNKNINNVATLNAANVSIGNNLTVNNTLYVAQEATIENLIIYNNLTVNNMSSFHNRINILASSIWENLTFGYLNSSGNVGTYTGNNNYGLVTNLRIRANEFHAYSSIKKKNILYALEEFKQDLIKKFDQINFIQYEYKDQLKEGGGSFFGYIAEELFEVFPNFVDMDAEDYAPNIMQKSKVIKKISSKLILVEYCFDNIGDEVLIIAENTVLYCRVEAINGNYSQLSSEDMTLQNNKDIFIYGVKTKVPSVSKTHVHDMSTVRLKILIDEVKELKEEVQYLKNELILIKGKI